MSGSQSPAHSSRMPPVDVSGRRVRRRGRRHRDPRPCCMAMDGPGGAMGTRYGPTGPTYRCPGREGQRDHTIQPELGLAHGDDRGEFVLVLGALPKEIYVLPNPDLALELTVEAAPEPAPTDPVRSPLKSRTDPLWDLPVETVESLDPADEVTLGLATPDGFTSTDTSTLTVRPRHRNPPGDLSSLQP